MSLLIWIIFGAVAGTIASALTASSNGLITNIIVGVVGAYIGSLVMGYLGYTPVTGFDLYSVFVAIIGSVIAISIARLIS